VKVFVNWHRQTREHIARWVQSFPGHDPEREALVAIVIEDMVRQLVAAGGIPPESRPISGIRPPRYWWNVRKGVWIQFMVEDEPWSLRALFRDRLRKVTVLRLQRERRTESEQ
jgi:hypothetical protein